MNSNNNATAHDDSEMFSSIQSEKIAWNPNEKTLTLNFKDTSLDEKMSIIQKIRKVVSMEIRKEKLLSYNNGVVLNVIITRQIDERFSAYATELHMHKSKLLSIIIKNYNYAYKVTGDPKIRIGSYGDTITDDTTFSTKYRIESSALEEFRMVCVENNQTYSKTLDLLMAKELEERTCYNLIMKQLKD